MKLDESISTSDSCPVVEGLDIFRGMMRRILESDESNRWGEGWSL